jgi:hypothetical protein
MSSAPLGRMEVFCEVLLIGRDPSALAGVLGSPSGIFVGRGVPVQYMPDNTVLSYWTASAPYLHGYPFPHES